MNPKLQVEVAESEHVFSDPGGGGGLSSWTLCELAVVKAFRCCGTHTSFLVYQRCLYWKATTDVNPPVFVKIGLVCGNPATSSTSRQCSTQQLPAQDRFRKPPLANSSSAFFPHCNPSNLTPRRRRRWRRGRSRGARAGGGVITVLYSAATGARPFP